MTTFHFFCKDPVGKYHYDTIEATDEDEATYGASQLGYNVVTGFYTTQNEAEVDLYSTLLNC